MLDFSRTTSALIFLALFSGMAAVQAQPAATVDHFSWTLVPSTAQAGLPFNVAVEARDAGDGIVTNFDGTISLAAFEEIPQSRALLISEAYQYSYRSAEFCNVGDTALNVGGWKVTFYDTTSWPGPRTTFIVPPGTICPPHGVFEVRGGGTSPGAYPVFFAETNLAWTSGQVDPAIAVLLRDKAGQLVDFFCAGSGFPFFISNPTPIPPEEWAGLPLRSSTDSFRSHQRTGLMDHNNAGDWAHVTQTLGAVNPGMRFPFQASLRALSVMPATATFQAGRWDGLLTIAGPAPVVRLRAFDSTGVAGESAAFAVSEGPPLFLHVPSQASEATPGLAGLGSVSIAQSLPTNLTISLNVDLTSEIILATSITLPAGQTNTTFAVTNLDDAVLDGTRVATVTATAPGFANSVATIANADNETAVATLTLPPSAREGDGQLRQAGRVTLDVAPAADLEVQLTSSDTNELQVLPVVTLLAGSNSVAFDLTIVNDQRLDGTTRTTVTAAAPAWGTVAGDVPIHDNEGTNMFLDLYAVSEEGRGVISNAIRVTLEGFAPSNVVVSLVSDAPNQLRVPPTLVVPAGQKSAYTWYEPVDDSLQDGSQPVYMTANAPGFVEARNGATVRDNDIQQFYIFALRTAQFAGELFPVTVYAHTVDGYIATPFQGTANLHAIGHAGEVSVTPAVVGPFTNGIWSGLVSVNAESRATRLTFDDGAGSVGSSNPFDVTDGRIQGLPVSDLVYDSLRGRIIAGVMAGGGIHSNSVVGINPATGTVTWRVALGHEPGRLAISDDFSMLYASHYGTGGVVRIDLNSLITNLRFPLGQDAAARPYFADDLEVVPGYPRSVVACRYNYGLAIYDEGIPRPAIVAHGPQALGYYVGFYGHSNRLFAPTPDAMRQLVVTSQGLFVAGGQGGRVYGTDFEFDSGLLYGTSGAIFHPDPLQVLGAFAASGRAVRPDAVAGRIAIVEDRQFRVFDQFTFAKIGEMEMPVRAGYPTGLIRCGADRYALRTLDNGLLILRTDMLPSPPPPADLSVSQFASEVAPTVGSNLTYTLTISNAGPATATNVVFVDQLPGRAAFVGVSSTAGTCTPTNGSVICSIGAMASGATAILTVTVEPTAPGELVNVARVLGGGLNRANDVSVQTNTVTFGAELPTVSEWSLNTAYLAFDSISNRLFASVITHEAQTVNKIYEISFRTGVMAPFHSLNWPPDQMAISTDGRYLHVGRSSSAWLRRLDLTGQTPYWETYIAGMVEMRVAPDQPLALAICRGIVFAVNNGSIQSQYPTDIECSAIEFGVAPTRLYGTGYAFHRFNFLSNGVTFASSVSGIHEPGCKIRRLGTRIFSSKGDVIDPEPGIRIARIPGVDGPMEVDPALNQVFYLGQHQITSQWILTAVDGNTFQRVWVYPIPRAIGTINSFISCGPGLLAFSTSANQLFVINTARVPHELHADLEASMLPPASAGPVGSPFTYTGYVRNNGLAPAFNVVVTNTFSPGTVVTAIYTAHGSCTNAGGRVICQLGDLPAGAAASYILTAHKTNAGVLLTEAVFSHNGTDPVLSNNVATFTAPIDAPPQADVKVWQTASLVPSTLGTNLQYSIVVSNQGPDSATDVSFRNDYPAGSVLLAASASGGTMNTNNGLVTVELGTLAAGTSASILVTVTLPPTELIVSRVQAWSPVGDPVPADNHTISTITRAGVEMTRQIAVAAADMAYDAIHRRLYASVPPTGGSLSNHVVVIDPDTAAIVRVIPLGEPLGQIAVSGNGQFLYVALARTSAVVRIDTATAAVGPRIELGNHPTWGPLIPFDLAVFSDSPESVAISMPPPSSGFNASVAIYDGLVRRTNAVELRPEAIYFHLGFTSSSNELLAVSQSQARRLPVDESGVTFDGPVASGLDSDFAVQNGRAYFDTGEILNSATMAIEGSFPVSGFVAPDLKMGRVFFLTEYTRLRAFDPATLSEMWAMLIDLGGFDRVDDLLNLEPNLLAVRTQTRPSIYLLNTAPLARPASDLVLSGTSGPDTPTVGATITSAVHVRNDGPWSAPVVIVSNALPAGVSFISATATRGSCTNDAGNLLCHIGALRSGESASITVTLTATTPGPATNRYVVLHPNPDPNPTNHTVILPATIVPPPTVSIADAAVREGSTQSSIQFAVSLSAPSSFPISVNYRTSNGTALAGQDYDAASGAVSFSPGTVARQIFLNQVIRGNSVPGTNRHFFVSLSNSVNAAIARSTAVATIVEDDFQTVSIQSAAVMEGNAGDTNAVFNLLLWPPATQPVSVHFQSFDGTATVGSDYSPRAGSLIFPAGVTNQTLVVPVHGDPRHELDETFYVVLSGLNGATLGNNEAAGQIMNDDAVPPFTIVAFDPVGDTWRIRFSSASGQTYRLQRSLSLTPDSWSDASQSIAGTGEPIDVLDAALPNNGSVFYRVQRAP